MTDARKIVDAAAGLRAEKTPFLVATVVRVLGSSYRRPGARLIATEERRVAGSISGGCLERDLVRTGWWRTRQGPVVVRYDSSDPDDPEAALGCGGIVDILLERSYPSALGTSEEPRSGERAGQESSADAIAALESAIGDQRPTAMATVFESTAPHLPVGTRFQAGGRVPPALGEDPLVRAVLESCRRKLASRDRAAPQRFEGGRGMGAVEALVESIEPPPSLFVFGAGFDAVPVVEAALRLGLHVTVWDPMSRFDTRARFPGAEVISGGPSAKLGALVDSRYRALGLVMSHDRRHDKAALAALLASRAEYIGVLGPRHRTETIAPTPDIASFFADPRVHAPVGLDLGAETPEEIALAVTAEILAALRSSSARELRVCGAKSGTPTAIHDAAAE
jgi:xanthine/CO dehydrogenase XdhC/CoxF family maturation factor